MGKFGDVSGKAMASLSTLETGSPPSPDGPPLIKVIVSFQFLVAFSIFIFAVIGVSIGAETTALLLLSFLQTLIAVPGMAYVFQRSKILLHIYAVLQAVTGTSEIAWIFFAANMPNGVFKCVALGVLALTQFLAVVIALCAPLKPVGCCRGSKKLSAEPSHNHLRDLPPIPKFADAGASLMETKTGTGSNSMASAPMMPSFPGDHSQSLKAAAMTKSSPQLKMGAAKGGDEDNSTLQSTSVAKKPKNKKGNTRQRFSNSKKELEKVLGNSKKAETMERIKKLNTKKDSAEKVEKGPSTLAETKPVEKPVVPVASASAVTSNTNTVRCSERSETNLSVMKKAAGHTPQGSTTNVSVESEPTTETSGFTIPTGEVTVSPKVELPFMNNSAPSSEKDIPAGAPPSGPNSGPNSGPSGSTSGSTSGSASGPPAGPASKPKPSSSSVNYLADLQKKPVVPKQ